MIKQHHTSFSGFTVLEILAALVIVGFLIALMVPRARNRLEDSEVIAALNHMNSIREAVSEGFYRDFGYIPEEAHWNGLEGVPHSDSDSLGVVRNQNPEYATRFLCMERDCTNEEITTYLWDHDLRNSEVEDVWLGEGGHPGCYFMAEALEQLVPTHVGIPYPYHYYRYYLLQDPAVGRRGWSGPYLEANSRFNATALNREDDWKYPDNFYSDADTVTEDVFFPVIVTPWADDLEATAMEAEAGAPALAAELRKGRYYQILVYSRNVAEIRTSGAGDSYVTVIGGHWEQFPETAVIICRGADGLPGSDSQAERLGAEDYWMQCAEMSKYALTDQQRRCFERLKITDPDDPDYVDIGDDMVLFIFGSGPVRSPLEK